MTQAVSVAMAVLIGCAASLQVALLGALARERGASGATLVSLLATVTALAVLLALRTALGSGPAIPWPLDRAIVLALVGAASGVLLALALRGIPPYFAITGALAVPFLLGASFLGPRLGVGLFLGAVITGQLTAGVLLDHIGAFGTEARPVDLARVAGIGALVVGVVLVRGVR